MMVASRPNRSLPQTAPYHRPCDLGPPLPMFSDEDLALVLEGGGDGPVPAPVVSGEALALARTLGAQYAEVIGHYAVDSMLGRTSRHGPKLRQIVKSLTRLAVEMGDLEILELYHQLEDLIAVFSNASLGEARQAASQRLRDWVMTFAGYVDEETATKLRRLVVFRKGVHPLISHLREIRGIGDKRLERLYVAGLLTTESLVEADPIELAQVVGVPLRLARQIVEASRRFFEQQRLVHVRSLQSAVGEVTRALREVDPYDESHMRLVATVRDTIAGLEQAMRDLETTWNTKTDL